MCYPVALRVPTHFPKVMTHGSVEQEKSLEPQVLLAGLAWLLHCCDAGSHASPGLLWQCRQLHIHPTPRFKNGCHFPVLPLPLPLPNIHIPAEVITLTSNNNG